MKITGGGWSRVKSHQLGHFLFYCPKGGYFCSVDLEMGVCVCLREVSTKGRLKMWSFTREIAGTAYDRCPLCKRFSSVEVGLYFQNIKYH